MTWLTTILTAAAGLGGWGYLVVLLVSAAESLAFVGLAIPGAIFTVFVGFLAAHGLMNPAYLIVSAAAGAVLGDGLSYYLGRRSSRHLGRLKLSDRLRRFLDRGEKYFQKHGNKSILLGRFVGPLRPIVPFVTGLFGVPPAVFAAWDVVSAILWATSYLLLGYFFGQTFQLAVAWSSRAAIFVVAIAAVLAAVYAVRQLAFVYGRKIARLLRSLLASIWEGLKKNPDVREFLRRHPGFHSFVKKRFDRSSFFGLPLTLLTLAAVYVLYQLISVIADVVTTDTLVTIDRLVENLLASFRDSSIADVFVWITTLGQWPVLLVFAAAVSAILWLKGRRSLLPPFWLTLSSTAFLVSVGKLLIHRARPELPLVIERSYAFPSGHAAGAVAFYGFLAFLAWKSGGRRLKIDALFGFLIVAAAVGFSRLYLGVHFLSDVLAGYLVGLLCLFAGIGLAGWKSPPNPRPVGVSRQAKRLIASAAISAAVLAYALTGLRLHLVNLQSVGQPRQTTVEAGPPAGIFDRYGLPKYTETLTASSQEPISLVIVAESDEALIGAFSRAGWYLADDVTFDSIGRLAETAVLNREYLSAPMTPSFWNNQVHDFGFQEPTQARSVRQRHHVRFWKTGYVTADGRPIYVGTASLDVGLKWGITHRISPDIDTERQYLLGTLAASGQVAGTTQEPLVKPELGANFSGDQFFTDGKVDTIFLK